MDELSGVSKDVAVDVLGVLLTVLAQPSPPSDAAGPWESVLSELESERASCKAAVQELKAQVAVLESGARLMGGRADPDISRHVLELEDLCRELARQRALLRQPLAAQSVEADRADSAKSGARPHDLEQMAADLALDVRHLRSQRRRSAKRGATPPRLAAEASALRAVIAAQEMARSEAELRLADVRASVRAFESVQAGRGALEEFATARLSSQAGVRGATEIGVAIGLLGQAGTLEVAPRPSPPNRQSPVRRSASNPGLGGCPRTTSPQRPAWRI